MDNNEFNNLRKKLGYTQQRLAIYLGKHLRTVEGYCRDRKIPKTVEIIMNNLNKEKENE